MSHPPFSLIHELVPYSGRRQRCSFEVRNGMAHHALWVVLQIKWMKNVWYIIQQLENVFLIVRYYENWNKNRFIIQSNYKNILVHNYIVMILEDVQVLLCRKAEEFCTDKLPCSKIWVHLNLRKSNAPLLISKRKKNRTMLCVVTIKDQNNFDFV